MLNFFKKIHGLTVIFCLLTFIIGYQAGHNSISQPTATQNIDFKLFWQVWDLVSRQYVDKKAIDPQKMYFGAISGMVAALGDPYTVFLPPESQKSTKEELGGSFDGVGMELGYNKDKRLVVIAPLKDTPADKAGIRAGDFILKINSKDATALSLPDAVSQIRGHKGSQVGLEIFREGEDKPRDLNLTRDTIVVKSVNYSQKTTPQGKKVAYLKLSRFGDRTFSEWTQVVSEAMAQSPQAVILDLRNNPGGFLDGAVFVGSEFIDSGNVVLQENASGERKNSPVTRAGKLTKIPVVVLINRGSASASEIVAGALQDYGRAKLVGDQSFGKGTVQESEELQSSTGLHITTAKWLTPKGRWIHNIGLTPEVKVEEKFDPNNPTKDAQLDKALEVVDQGQ